MIVGRLLLILMAGLALAAPGAAHAQDINPLTGKPYVHPEQVAKYREHMRAEDARAEEANETLSREDEALRLEKREQLLADEARTQAWIKAHPMPPGAVDAYNLPQYGDGFVLQRTTVIYVNRQSIPTHEVELDTGGQPTGPVRQTRLGKAWETIGPHVAPGAPPQLDYGEAGDGEPIIRRADIRDAKDRRIAEYEFNEDGSPWRGETFDPQTGARTGGFQDERLKTGPRQAGGALDVPSAARLITGVCEKCRPLVNRHNALAAQINQLIAELQSLSERHQRAFAPAQGPIRVRYDVVKAEIAALTPQLEAARAEALACDQTCRLPAVLPDGVVRPTLAPVTLEAPKSFCSQVQKVEFLKGVYNPAAATALANSQAAQAHLTRLNSLFTEYMRKEGGPIWAEIQREMAEYKPIAETAYAESGRINALYQTILEAPLIDCPQLADNTAVADAGQPLVPVKDAAPGKPDCPPKERRKPIVVGPNGKVGSGARLKAKAASTAMGIAGGLLGGALPGGGGGGGGGSGGPATVVCKIKDGEMTVFNDPASGVSLKVGAKRAGGTVVVFSEIARSPDNGTFQTAFLENPQGEAMAPADVGICDLWGEWKLTVSWTKTTYVDGQVVKRESGGWQKAGRFSVPGVLSTVERPDGLWKQLGFSNASHGARKIAMQYKLPVGGEPVDAIIHVTRPGGDPVTTVPFALRMVEGPNGFTFTKAPDTPCPPESTQVRADPIPTPPVAASNPPPAEPGSVVRQTVPVENLYALEQEIDRERTIDEGIFEGLEKPRLCGDERSRSSWPDLRDLWMQRMTGRLNALRAAAPTGPLADGVRQAIEAEKARIEAMIEKANALTFKCAPYDSLPPLEPTVPERTPSILDSIEEVPVIS
jgi:hypothetical protein